eukprot:6172768-Pleurochrysis_carterae.AAC.1
MDRMGGRGGGRAWTPRTGAGGSIGSARPVGIEGPETNAPPARTHQDPLSPSEGCTGGLRPRSPTHSPRRGASGRPVCRGYTDLGLGFDHLTGISRR